MKFLTPIAKPEKITRIAKEKKTTKAALPAYQRESAEKKKRQLSES